MNSSTSEWLVLTRNFVAGSHPQNDIIGAAFVLIDSARPPAEPFFSVNFSSTRFYGMSGINVEVSNRMAFNVNCSVEPEVLSSGKWVSAALWEGNIVPLRILSSLTPHSHSKETVHIMQPQPFEGVRVHVSYYERPLKPIEMSVLNKLPWLKKHYPFSRLRSFTFYPTPSDFDISQFKTYP